MRVGLVVRGGADRSGRERVIPALLWLIERIARRHELHVFALHHEDRPSTYTLLGAQVHDLGCANVARGLRRLTQERRLATVIDGIGAVDLLHAYWAVPAGWVATRVASRRRVPCVVTADSGEWVALPDIGYGLQRRWTDRRAVAATMRAASRVTVCTDAMSRLAEAHDVKPEIIPIGVPATAAPVFDRPAGPPWRLVHVASLNRVKDHGLLIDALASLVALEPRVHLDVVGEDTLGGEVQRLAFGRGVSGHVTFHGLQPADAVSAFYSRAHVHVVTSRHEAAGVVTLEAAAAGVPTVGTPVGYVADWSRNGRAIAVPPANAEGLAAAILDLLRDAPKRARVAAAAWEWTHAHDADWTADRFDRLYRELV